MTLFTGEANVFEGQGLITSVKYRLNRTKANTSQDIIKGKITVPDNFVGFLDSKVIYKFVATEFPEFNFWVQRAHPVVIDPNYEIVVAPPS